MKITHVVSHPCLCSPVHCDLQHQCARSRNRWLVPAGASIAAVLAFLRIAKPWQSPRTPVTSTTGATAVRAATVHQEPSVAVLPFEDLSEKKNEAYFSDGLSIKLIDQLAKIPGLRVPARVSSFYFKGRQATLQEIARSLHVTHVLEGTVSSSGEMLRVSTDLVSVAAGTPIWSETYDHELGRLYAIPEVPGGTTAR